MHSEESGGVAGNEALTFATAAVLTVLLIAEGVTVFNVRGLLRPHMFIGLLLIGPVVLKLASVGYRFVRYYTHSRTYRAKGPPQLALRMLAPVLVLATVVMFGSGIWLMALGRRNDTVLELHKVAFIVWVVFFGLHFLAYAPRVLNSLRRRSGLAGARLRTAAVGAALGGGLTLALALFGLVSAWRGGHHHHHEH